MDSPVRAVARAVVALTAGAVAAVAGYVLFVATPDGVADLLGVVLALGAVVAGLRFGSNLGRSALPGYDVAEVAVEGPIRRGGGGGLPTTPRSTPVDDVVEQIERADADGAARALLLRLNTPGGEVVPSDDVRAAAESFDGPTVAYATDVCASGGYWIASGCDEFWARDASLVGSIGVVLSQVNAAGLAERLGVEYEGFTAGEYKDAGTPLKELDGDDRAYFQGLVDDWYDAFVERVTEGRDLDPEFVRDTEARVYLGEEAARLGLVDEVGRRDDVEAAVAARLGVDDVEVREFAPTKGLTERLRRGATTAAFAFGAGVASALGGDAVADRFELR